METIKNTTSNSVVAEYSGFHVGRREGEQGASQVHDESVWKHQKHVSDAQLQPPNGCLHAGGESCCTSYRVKGLGSMIKCTSFHFLLINTFVAAEECGLVSSSFINCEISHSYEV